MKILLIPVTGRNGFRNDFHVSNSFCFLLQVNFFFPFLFLHKCKKIFLAQMQGTNALFEKCQNTTLSDPSINKNTQRSVSSK